MTKGKATLSYSTNTLLIRQSTPTASFSWTGFNVGSAQSVSYRTPGSSSVSMNFIGGRSPAQIYGKVTSNGILYFMDANGIVFGSGSTVSAAGIRAYGAATPGGTPTGAVTNAGILTAGPGGQVVLVGTSVTNAGTIDVPSGQVVLAAGSTVTLTQTPSSSLSVASTGGGTVLDSGVIRAENTDGTAGAITLEAGMGSGTTTLTQSAVLDASAPDGGNGGTVETSGARVDVADGAAVTTAARFGQTGLWTLDPASFYIGCNTGTANSTKGNVTGYEDISGAQLGSDLTTTAVTIESTQGAKGALGNIYVDAAVTWGAANKLTLEAVNNIEVNAAITNTDGSLTGGVMGSTVLSLHADDMAIGGTATNATGGGVPSGNGTVAVNTGGSLSLASGNANITYNPTNYATPTPYKNANGAPASGTTLSAFMLLSTNPDLYYIDQNQNSTILANDYALNTSLTLPTVTGSLSGADLTQVQAATGANGETFASGASTNSNWLRFGGSSTPYTGILNGQGYTISNLVIDDTMHITDGLVGQLSGTIERIGVTGGTIANSNSFANVGGLAGIMSGNNVAFSYATGTVTGGIVGGLVGETTGGTIQNSYATGTVTGTDYGGDSLERPSEG